MAKRFGFGKKEKLKSRKRIDALFAKGKTFTVFPIRVVYQLEAADPGGIQAGVSAPKRHFKKAVDRNRIKRLLREAYRLQKAPLVAAVQQRNCQAFVFFMYTDKAIASFDIIQPAMGKCLARLQKNLTEAHEIPS